MLDWARRNWPALSLALLAPAIAEVLSGSTRITVLFYAPLFFVLDFAGLMLLYGGAALLIREAAVRWKKGWGSVLLLGAAYGIVEEGLAVHTFFQAGGAPVGALGSFGRFDGVNLLWALGLTVYHATISIALPILLVELAYPATRGTSFLAGRSLWAVAIGYVSIVVLFSAVVPSFPSYGLLVVALAAVGALVAVARWVPRDLLRATDGPARAPHWAFALAGTGMMFDWLIAGLSGPWVFRSAWLSAGVFVAVLALLLLFLLRRAGTEGLELTKYWFAAGMIGFFFLWDVILEFVLVPGILLVTAAFAVYLYWLHRRVSSAAAPSTLPGPASPSQIT